MLTKHFPRFNLRREAPNSSAKLCDPLQRIKETLTSLCSLDDSPAIYECQSRLLELRIKKTVSSPYFACPAHILIPNFFQKKLRFPFREPESMSSHSHSVCTVCKTLSPDSSFALPHGAGFDCSQQQNVTLLYLITRIQKSCRKRNLYHRRPDRVGSDAVGVQHNRHTVIRHVPDDT